tara:strand:+ start:1545 stop:2246 length:702 start_codon:yes stop_codon:yes gene_type:complete
MELKKCITSYGFKYRKQVFEKTKPFMEEYASSCRADFFSPRVGHFQEWIEGQELFSWDNPSAICWLKIPLLISLLEDYDEVLWLDADVVVTGSDNVFKEALDAPMGMVLGQCDAGEFYNTGVWLVKKEAKEFLSEIKINPDVAKGGRWFRAVGYDGEMPMVLDALGVDVKSDIICTPESDMCGELDYKYHNIFHDYRKIQEDAVFAHACGISMDWFESILEDAKVWDYGPLLQ